MRAYFLILTRKRTNASMQALTRVLGIYFRLLLSKSVNMPYSTCWYPLLDHRLA
jgi:hypothetical protein